MLLHVYNIIMIVLYTLGTNEASATEHELSFEGKLGCCLDNVEQVLCVFLQAPTERIPPWALF